ncbi:hypothetical protein ACFWOB_38305 [Streptomyces sp. NPDC058420]|uniref:hypothetical protein n=1 Tax=Streptomyces sp. NPDC058420 TaxID=3346489 RepID=UPI003660D263
MGRLKRVTRGCAPAEAVAFGLPDYVLPDEGWGHVTLHRYFPQTGTRWAGTGRLHDGRGLKNRPDDDSSELVPALRRKLPDQLDNSARAFRVGGA